jgi:hypothetical protein
MIKQRYKLALRVRHISISVCVLLSCIAVPAFSQFTAALKAGFNYSSLKMNTRSSYPGWKMSAHIGTSFAYQLDERIILGGDLLLSDKGYSSDNSKLHLVYAAVPLYMRFKIIKNLYVDAGAGVALLLASRHRQHSQWTNSKDFYGNEADFQALTGVHYKIASRIGLTLRYEHSISNVVNEDAELTYFEPIDPPTGSSSFWRGPGYFFRNKNIQLSVCYSLKSE